VREFEFGDRALRGRDDLTRNFELPYAEIAALIRAAQISTLDSTVTTVEKKLNVGRALMTGGLMMNKKVEKTTHSASEEREQVLYAFPRGTHTPLVFRESVLRYQGLGPHLKSVTAQNFATLIELLRERAPHALYDQRMLTQKRKVGVTSFAGLATDRRVESSNASENELAATLIVLAHEQGQL
jgi:hypothetical protein